MKTRIVPVRFSEEEYKSLVEKSVTSVSALIRAAVERYIGGSFERVK